MPGNAHYLPHSNIQHVHCSNDLLLCWLLLWLLLLLCRLSLHKQLRPYDRQSSVDPQWHIASKDFALLKFPGVSQCNQALQGWTGKVLSQRAKERQEASPGGCLEQL